MTSSTAARMSGSLIAPHGGELINRTVTGDEAAVLAEEARGLPRVHMTEKQTADLDMIASGALSPLTGFMVKDDYERVVEEMRLENGLPWALPVTLSVPEKPSGGRLALEGHEGDLLAVIDVADVFEADRTNEATKVFRTTDDAHPGVAQVYAEGNVLVGGPDTVAAILEMTGGFGADYTFEATGLVAVMRQAVEAARMGWGLATVAGVAGKGETLDVIPRLLITGRRIAGSSFGGVKGRVGVPALIERWLAGEIDVDPFVSHHLKLAEVNRGFELMEAQDGIRSVLHFS
jgi:hypothetical protein